MKRIHALDTKKVPQCEICWQKFPENAGLEKHIAIAHEGKKIKCEICNNVFSHKRSLKQHIMLIHEGKKPFNCGFCDYSSGYKSHVNRHVASIH